MTDILSGAKAPRNDALFFQKAEVVLQALGLEAGGDESADAVHHTQQQGKVTK